MKLYSLYCNVEGIKEYPIHEAIKNDLKRGHNITIGERIEEIDSLTACFTSTRDLNEGLNEAHGVEKRIYNPLIYVDKDEKDRSKSYVIEDIVYEEDKKYLDNREDIKNRTFIYLLNNPNSRTAFRGIIKIYNETYKNNPYMDLNSILKYAINKYFSGLNYKCCREAYFTLKNLNQIEEKKHEIHR